MIGRCRVAASTDRRERRDRSARRHSRAAGSRIGPLPAAAASVRSSPCCRSHWPPSRTRARRASKRDSPREKLNPSSKASRPSAAPVRVRISAAPASPRKRVPIRVPSSAAPTIRMMIAGNRTAKSQSYRKSNIPRPPDMPGGSGFPDRPRYATSGARSAAARAQASAGVLVEQVGELLHHRAAQFLGIDDGDGAAVVAGDVVADADRDQLDRRARSRSSR